MDSLPDISQLDVRVVVGIDFGTTFSGFAYAHKINPESVETQDIWPDERGAFKTPTVLLYDASFEVVKWGQPALASRPKKKQAQQAPEMKPVELFKLHLGDMKEKPSLPPGLDPKKAITDYFFEMGKLIKQTIATRWPGVDFHRHVLKVLTVPAEFDDKAKFVMRTCAFNAELIDTLNTELLEFTPEPEAAAIYCLRVLNQHDLKEGDSYLICDCGGGTVDLTLRSIVENDSLNEITERTGDFCGSTYVDKEFLKFLATKVGHSAMERLENENYGQLQYMVQQFCQQVKFQFDGKPSFRTKELDLEEVCPVLMQHTTDSKREEMERAEWLIELDYETVKGFFDRVLDKIITLIRNQLVATGARKPKAIFMVGGFSESPYVLAKVRENFNAVVPTIAVPSEPIAAVVRGAVHYGLNMDQVRTRVLKRTYGVEVWEQAGPLDPPSRVNDRGVIKQFHRLAQRGTEVPVDRKFVFNCWPIYPEQTSIKFLVYTSPEDDGRYCDDPGMKLYGRLSIELPDPHLGRHRPVEFSLTFGKNEVRCVAYNKSTLKEYSHTFALEL